MQFAVYCRRVEHRMFLTGIVSLAALTPSLNAYAQGCPAVGLAALTTSSGAATTTPGSTSGLSAAPVTSDASLPTPPAPPVTDTATVAADPTTTAPTAGDGITDNAPADLLATDPNITVTATTSPAVDMPPSDPEFVFEGVAPVQPGTPTEPDPNAIDPNTLDPQPVPDNSMPPTDVANNPPSTPSPVPAVVPATN